MSTIVKFFTAPNDQAAVSILQNGPDDTFETLTFGNFDAISAIEEWDQILTGRSAGDLDQDDVPRIITTETPFIIATSTALCHALASATAEELAQAAYR
ncbi:MAG TPA: hypothetical protein VGX23_08170 [Actinocrinis sp.]|nr:hypothetical protein [Actinocrinis sp.]